MSNINNQNPIETLLANSSSIADIIYLCENGLSHLLNKKAASKEKYDFKKDIYYEEESDKTVLNKYFNRIWQFTDHDNNISDFLNKYCIKHFKDSLYFKNEKSPEEFIKSMQVAEKSLLYFYGQIYNPVYIDSQFIKNIVFNFEKYKKNKIDKVIYDFNFECPLSIIFDELTKDSIKYICPDLIHIAVAGDSMKAVDFLIERGFDINHIDNNGYSCAFKARSPKMLEKLLNYNVELINQQDKGETILNITKGMRSEKKAEFNAVLKKHIDSKKDAEQFYSEDYIFIDTVKSFEEPFLTKKSFVKLWKQNNIQNINHIFEYDGKKTSILGHLLHNTNKSIENTRNIMDTVISSRLAIARFLMENGASINITSNEQNNDEKDKNLLILLIETIHAKKYYTLPSTSETNFRKLIGKQIKKFNLDFNDFNIGINYLKKQQDNSKYNIICHTVDYLYLLFSLDEQKPLGYYYQKSAFNAISDVLMESLGKKKSQKRKDRIEYDEFDFFLTLDDFNEILFKDDIMDVNGDLRIKNDYLGLIVEIFKCGLNKKHFCNDNDMNREGVLLRNANQLVSHLGKANRHIDRLVNIVNEKKKYASEHNIDINPELVPLEQKLNYYYLNKRQHNTAKKQRPIL